MRPHRSLGRAVWIVLVALLAGCASAQDGDGGHDEATSTTVAATTSTPPTTVPPTTTTTVALPSPQPIAWSPCGGGFDCGTLTVPISYLAPEVGTLDLALIRRPASDPESRIGSLVMNPGGPGASGVARVRRGFSVSPEVASRFDIIGFDPRGIGGSTPITCGSAVASFRAADLDPDSPEEEALLEIAARAVADECHATEGARLANLGTIDVVHDLEMIRRSLGEPQVSFVGLSYGTLIGVLWAEAYPDSVRAMVLDGVVDPAARGGVASVAQVDAIEDVLRALDEACQADPACPLQTAGGALAAYDELHRRIEAGEASGHGVGPTQLAYAAFFATYDSDHWPRLWSAVADGLRGDLHGVHALARSFTRLVEYAPFALVTCLDGEHPAGYEAWQAEAEELAQRSPRFGRTVSNELLPCAWWPPSRFEPHPVRASGAPPILVIGSTGDAATPYDQAVLVADTLASGALLTVEIEGHVALGDSPCAADVATRYLVDLAVPPPGTRC